MNLHFHIHEDLTDATGLNAKPHISFMVENGNTESMDKVFLMLRNDFIISKVVDDNGQQYELNDNHELVPTDLDDKPF